MNNEEQRQDKRINLVIDVKYHMSTYQNWLVAPTLVAKTENLSTGGVCLLTNTYIPVGSFLDLIFVIPETSISIEVSGEIIWNEKNIDDEYYTNGVKFLSLKNEEMELIGKFIDNATFDMRRCLK